MNLSTDGMEEGLGPVALVIILLPANTDMTSLPVTILLHYVSICCRLLKTIFNQNL
jgi:hypothetical protein